MTPDTLKHIKSQLAPLYKLAFAIAKEREQLAGYMVVAVFLQNAQFDSTDCANHNHEEEVNELFAIQKIFHLFHVYLPEDSFYNFIYKEYTAIIEGTEMCELIEGELDRP